MDSGPLGIRRCLVLEKLNWKDHREENEKIDEEILDGREKVKRKLKL